MILEMGPCGSYSSDYLAIISISMVVGYIRFQVMKIIHRSF
jgi:hypothetical protein